MDVKQHKDSVMFLILSLVGAGMFMGLTVDVQLSDEDTDDVSRPSDENYDVSEDLMQTSETDTTLESEYTDQQSDESSNTPSDLLQTPEEKSIDAEYESELTYGLTENVVIDTDQDLREISFFHVDSSEHNTDSIMFTHPNGDPLLPVDLMSGGEYELTFAEHTSDDKSSILFIAGQPTVLLEGVEPDTLASTSSWIENFR